MTLKYALTDDQLGQFYRKMNAIADRMGKSLPFEQVMQALRRIHDGREIVIPTVTEEPKAIVKQNFTKWKTFKIGGVTKKALLRRVSACFEVNDRAKSVMTNRGFTTIEQEQSIDTIIITPAEFGYTQMPSTAEVLDPGRLVQWCEQNANLLDDHVVELLPAEAGPHIREQYKDQPNEEEVVIAMNPIPDCNGDPSYFRIGRFSFGKQWLYTDRVIPRTLFHLNSRIVFHFRKMTKS